MNKKRSSEFRYRTTHPSFLPSPVLDTALSSDCSQHRNNHNSDFIPYDEVHEIIPRKRRVNDHSSSVLPISINYILLILIRLMILFIAVLVISSTFYYGIVYVYSKPKKSGWERMIDWFFQE
jgi:hypothetical protein